MAQQSEIQVGTPIAEQNNLAVEAHKLVKVFGDNRAVDGVDLSIPSGCIYALLGPNGAGKTTIINMLNTLLKPDGGSAKVFGHDVVREAQIVRQLISVTGQSAAVDEKLSASENLTIFALLLGLSRPEARKRAADLLQEFGLADAANRTLDKFSGGMRRRLDLASSLIVQAPLIFLDEPTSGLDPRTRIQMWESIRRLVSSGSTILLTTQYLDEADHLADRIAVIDHGRVVAEGTSRELKAAVGKATLHLQLADDKDTAEAIRITETVLNVRASPPEPTLVTAPMGDPDRVTDLLVALRQAKIHLANVSMEEPTLDEVFLALTGDVKLAEKGVCHAMTAQIVPGAQRRLKNSVTLRRTISNSLTMAYRNLLMIRRTPQQLFDVTIQPILFTLMFVYLFGGAISGSVSGYLPIIIPGILAQTALTACIATGVQLREDMDKGVFYRFKSMPIARIAPLTGPLLADVVRYTIATSLCFVMGYVLGFRWASLGELSWAASWSSSARGASAGYSRCSASSSRQRRRSRGSPRPSSSL